MKITIYELLELIKEGKAPSNIKYDGKKYYMNLEDRYIRIEDTKIVYLSNEYDLTKCLNNEVEIIEEDKEIEELNLMFPICNDIKDAELGGFVSIYNSNLGEIKYKFGELIKEVNKIKKEGK